MSKVMFCGDPHGANHIIALRRFAEKYGCDHVVFLGDCWDVDIPIDSPGPVVWMVVGNHEKRIQVAMRDEEYVKVLPRDGWFGNIGGYSVAAFGGVDREAHRQNLLGRAWSGSWLYEAIMSSGETVACFNKNSVIRNLHGTEECDFLLTHDAPWGQVVRSGDVVGSEFIKSMVKTIRPRFQLNGHMHYFNEIDVDGVRCIQLSDVTGKDNGFDCAIWDGESMSFTTFR